MLMNPNMSHSRSRYLGIGMAISFMLAVVALFLLFWMYRNNTAQESQAQTTNGANDARQPLVVYALRPTIGGIFSPKRGEVEDLLARLALAKDPTLSDVLHGLHLFGGDLRIPAGEGSEKTIRAVDLLLDSKQGKSVFGMPTLCATRYGARFFIHNPVRLGTNQNAVEAHPGQALSVLAELGIPLSQPIRLPGNRQATLQVVLDDLIANFVLEGEIYWDAVALALYVPPARAWKNKFGKEFTFDALAEELLARPIMDSSCAGTHRLIALTILLRVDGEEGVLAPEVRSRIRSHLNLVAKTLTASQRGDGSWLINWADYLPGAKPSQSWGRENVTGAMIATGHHLEWLMLLPEEMRPPRQVYVKAAQWLLATALRQSKNIQWLRSRYCPATHAARTVKMIARPVET